MVVVWFFLCFFLGGVGGGRRCLAGVNWLALAHACGGGWVVCGILAPHHITHKQPNIRLDTRTCGAGFGAAGRPEHRHGHGELGAGLRVGGWTGSKTVQCPLCRSPFRDLCVTFKLRCRRFALPLFVQPTLLTVDDAWATYE